MSDLIQHGDPSRFAIALRWVADSEPRSQRPTAHGWSMGDLRITVGGTVITRSTHRGRVQGHVGWYLSPLIDWLATNWTFLLHEEDFDWQEPTGLPAAVACRKALHTWINADDPVGRERYRAVQAWYRRHGLRAVAEGGLFPDLFIRRLMDDAELSWNAAPPIHAPDGFTFMAEPAHASFAIDDIAAPLWAALRWFANAPPPGLESADQARWETIARKIDALDGLSVEDLQAPYLPAPIANLLGDAETPQSLRSPHAPVVAEFSPAVAMFGGVSPNLSHADARCLLGILAEGRGSETEELARLARERGMSPLGIPHRDGYDFAQDFLDDLGLPDAAGFIDVEGIAAGLGIIVERKRFDSRDIRGVALAGNSIGPRIIINSASIYNVSQEGQRFTIAHELCHLLHDRSRARRVTHVSGPWVAQGFERRANAFAAYLLMPRALVIRHLDGRAALEPETVRGMAEALRVSESSLVEHMFNLQMIEDWERERLRPLFRPFTR